MSARQLFRVLQRCWLQLFWALAATLRCAVLSCKSQLTCKPQRCVEVSSWQLQHWLLAKQLVSERGTAAMPADQPSAA